MQDIERLRDEQTQIVKQEKKESETIKGRLRALLPRPRVDIFEAGVHTNAEMADISGLVATARSQADIARRDREKREARAQAAAEEETRRDQWELDALPDPYDEEFVRAYPHDADDCTARVFINPRRGADAEEIRKKSAPIVAAESSRLRPAGSSASRRREKQFQREPPAAGILRAGRMPHDGKGSPGHRDDQSPSAGRIP